MQNSARLSQRLSLVHSAPSSYPPYLHRRGQCFYFKRKIPADCVDIFPGLRGQVWKSLGTTLFERAKVMLAVEVTEFDLLVARHRNKRATRLASATPSSAAVRPGPRTAPPRAAVGDAAGLAPPPVGQDHLTLLSSIEASLNQLRLMSGGSASGPTQSVGQTSSATSNQVVVHQRGRIAPTMLHLFEDWTRKQTRPRTVGAVRKAVLEFHDLHGSLPVDSINRQHARDYRDALIERKLSDGTIENRLGFLSTLMRHGLTEMVEHLTGNPFENIAVYGGQGQRAPKDRRAFAVSELNMLFASQLYTRGYRPQGQSVEAAYWMPLLGPFVGARIEELAQLRVEDVQRVNGSWCVRICDLDVEQNVKNGGSFRRIPLHDAVIKCGFLTYVAKQAEAGAHRVFPSLSNVNANQIWSNSVGKWFGRYLDTIGLSDNRLDYHSFRYSFRQQCSLCGIEDETRDALTGHWVSNSKSGRTYMKAENRQYPYPKLVAAMKQFRYDELKMAHLFVDAPLKGVEDHLLR